MQRIDRFLFLPALLMLILTVGSYAIGPSGLDWLRSQFSGFGFFCVQLIPLPLAWIALWPRNAEEKFVAPLSFDKMFSSKLSWRRMLVGPFAPYTRPMKGGWIGLLRHPYLVIGLVVMVSSFLWIWMLPAFSYIAFLMLIRRSAYAGSGCAVKIERDFLKLRYPTKACRSFNALLA